MRLATTTAAITLTVAACTSATSTEPVSRATPIVYTDYEAERGFLEWHEAKRARIQDEVREAAWYDYHKRLGEWYEHHSQLDAWYTHFAELERQAERRRREAAAVSEPTPAPAAPTPQPTPAPAPSPAPAAPSGSVWDQLAQCESGGNWSINTGNGYYGGLQFLPSTWHSVGGTGLPHEHSREEQIKRGQILQQRAGWGQWPACARKLGLL